MSCVNGYCPEVATRWFTWRIVGSDERSEPVCDRHFDEYDEAFRADGFEVRDGCLVADETIAAGRSAGIFPGAGMHGERVAVEAGRVLENRAGYARDGQPEAAWTSAVALCGYGANTRYKVLCYIGAQGADGATNVELEAALELKRPSGSNRRLELQEAGLVAQDPRKRTRATEGGQQATVYVITALGQAVIDHINQPDLFTGEPT